MVIQNMVKGNRLPSATTLSVAGPQSNGAVTVAVWCVVLA